MRSNSTLTWKWNGWPPELMVRIKSLGTDDDDLTRKRPSPAPFFVTICSATFLLIFPWKYGKSTAAMRASVVYPVDARPMYLQAST